jgi:hypothetical protein
MLSSIRVPLAIAVALACLALAPAATAAPGSGNVTLTVGGKGQAARALAAAGVEAGAIAPATRSGKRLKLPVKSVAFGKAATVALRGGIRLKAGRRSLKLRSVRLKLTTKQVTISAKAGASRRTVFVAKPAKGRSKLDRSKLTASLATTKLGLTPAGAKLVRQKLGVSGVSAGTLGQLGLKAGVKSGSGTKPGGGGPGGGGGGGGGPQSGPIKNPPPVLARPAGAVDVTSATLTWRPRESWIQYINGGEGTSVFGGAVNGPGEVKSGSSATLVYSFHGFPFKNGWYHPATGTAAIYFSGGVGFRWSAHGINFSAADPEIEINGGASRAIFLFNGTDDTVYDNQRGVLVDLDPGTIQTPPSGSVIYTDVPGSIPQDTGESVFAGFYPADTPFGTMTVSFTTP